MKFQFVLYGKLFRKAPQFDQVNTALIHKWEGIGEVFISDLRNGFLLIQCLNLTTKQLLLEEGPWSINGIILQLSPWKPYFELAFAKLTIAAIWVQFHNLPVEFWGCETLETIASQLGTLLRIDELTTSLVRTKYARVCIEINLSKPLNKGFYIGDDIHCVFVVLLYERLPTFCYVCGMIGHGSNKCTHKVVTGDGKGISPPPRAARGSAVSPPPNPNTAIQDELVMEHHQDPLVSESTVNPQESPPKMEFGP